MKKRLIYLAGASVCALATLFMMQGAGTSRIAMAVSYSGAQGPFEWPEGSRPYDQVCWLSSHNAYAAENYGYVYANQKYTLKEQLDRGVRQFELDIEKPCNRLLSVQKPLAKVYYQP